jgi:hypothetical protein
MLFEFVRPGNKDFPTILDLIKTQAGEKFGWQPGYGSNYFYSEDSMAVSDSIPDLKKAIANHIGRNDVVLTTPMHKKYFLKARVKRIAVYDISPAQLIQANTADAYWCDIFNRNLLFSLLSQVNPTAMYLSNIAERTWGEIAPVNDLADSLNDFAALKKVLVSGVMDGGELSQALVDRLKCFNWETKMYKKGNLPHSRRIFVASRGV